MGSRGLLPAAFGIPGHPLDHHDKHHAAFIPTAQPTHPPAVDLIPQPRFSEKSQVLRFYAHNSHDIHGSQTPKKSIRPLRRIRAGVALEISGGC